jgi:carboxyl-terminal processing protease
MSFRSSFAVRWFAIAAFTVASVALLHADPVAPGPTDRQIALVVTTLTKRLHLSHHPLDKEISNRCFDQLMKTLDPLKAYFYQSDIDELGQDKDDLCRQLQTGDVSFVYKAYPLYLKRIDERVKMIDEILAGPLDFTADDQWVYDRDKLQYPKTPEEAKARWTQRLKYDLLALKTADKKEEKFEGKAALEKLKTRYHGIAKRAHKLDGNEVLEFYLNSFTLSFDPHTDYMSADTQKNFEILMSLGLEGIGATLQSSDDGYTVIKKLVRGGAAAKEGHLKVDDKIVSVGQEDGDMVDIVDMKLSDVVKLVRGKPGTSVRLEVIPADGSGRKIYKIAREKIELKESEAQGQVFDVGKKADGTPYRIGVIDLPSFYRDMTGERNGTADFRSTTRDCLAIIENFKKKGVDGIVLDLRFNGGGSLEEAISLTGLFIPDGPVVQTKDGDNNVKMYSDRDPGVAWSGPLVVVISRLSASASEILAGAIQDYHRGLIVGDHSTHGKGTVQSMLDVGEALFHVRNSPKMGALKITMSQFYRINGESTQRRGVLSDVELPSVTTYLDGAEASLDYALEFDKIPAVSYKVFPDVSPDVCKQLSLLSAERLKTSKDFQKVARNIVRFKEREANKAFPLNEEKYLKWVAEYNADKDKNKALEHAGDLGEGKSGIERDFYLDEVMAVTVDFIGLRSNAIKNQEQAAAKSGAW